MQLWSWYINWRQNGPFMYIYQKQKQEIWMMIQKYYRIPYFLCTSFSMKYLVMIEMGEGLLLDSRIYNYRVQIILVQL